MNANKTKKIPTLDYGEIDDVLDALSREIVEHGPIAELAFLARDMTKSELTWHRKHRKYLESLMKKVAVILDAHKKCPVTGNKVPDGMVVEHVFPMSKGGKNEASNLRLVRKNENKN